jgi:hypothetical protein
MPINNPVLNRVISEVVRPTSERARGLLVEAQTHAQSLASLVAALSEYPDDEIIDDGRLSEGVSPLTVGQFRQAVGLLSELTASIAADPRLQAVFGACVRPLQAR